ncbi:hypothetical protein RKK42_00005 [Klebsiella pneumoniae]|nr:hypothetical protein [Klebsiella pneumoniae]
MTEESKKNRFSLPGTLQTPARGPLNQSEQCEHAEKRTGEYYLEGNRPQDLASGDDPAGRSVEEPYISVVRTHFKR